MKRKLAAPTGSPAKKPKQKEPDYHLTPSVRDEDGEIVWPAPKDQIKRAREIILQCAQANETTLIVPDKDADGLTSGVILYKTLLLLGQSPETIKFHLLQKGQNVHSDGEKAAMQSHNPSYIFVLDQGSRPAPPLVDTPHTALVIDHHFATATDFPANAAFVTACHSPPVATSSLLTYTLCTPLHPTAAPSTAWLCALGTFGDLGNTLKWSPPFPDLASTFAQHPRKSITDAVPLLNAPRRTATYDVPSALTALLRSTGPKDLLADPRLHAARAEVTAEVERCTHTPPKFSADGTVAVLRIHSGAQVHPLIATRWAAHLSSSKLAFVLVANSGYLPDKVNFSCRVARVARTREPAVDIIAALKEAAALHPSGDLRERLGADFARGHVQASGGVVGVEEFEELMAGMGVGEKVEREKKVQKGVGQKGGGQKNTLTNYFAKG